MTGRTPRPDFRRLPRRAFSRRFQKSFVPTRLAVAVLLLFLSTLVWNCGNPEHLLLYAEEFWWEFLDDRPDFRMKLEEAARQFELVLLLNNTGGDPAQILAENRSIRVAITGPFLASEEGKLATQYPEILFIGSGMGSGTAGEQPPNLLRIAFNRTEAYQEAGRRIGELVVAQGNAAGARAGILSLESGEQGEKELAAFREGFNGVASESLLTERRLLDRYDRVEAVKALEEMKKEGAQYFLLEVFGLNIYCLDYLQREGGKAVVSDLRGGWFGGESVLFSIEEDHLGSLVTSLPLMDRRRSRWAVDRVMGRVFLQEGGQGPSPKIPER
jgi:hypothetical protein